MSEIGSNLLKIDFFAHLDCNRARVNFRNVGEDRPGKALGNDSFVLHVEIRKENDKPHCQAEKCGEGKAQNRIVAAIARALATVRNSDFYSHY